MDFLESAYLYKTISFTSSSNLSSILTLIKSHKYFVAIFMSIHNNAFGKKRKAKIPESQSYRVSQFICEM